MKKLSSYIFIILIIILSFHSSYSQWFQQYSFSPAQSLYAIKFFDANTGWCVAPLYNSSTFNIHKTTNAGANWIDQSSGYTAMRFMCIWIVDKDTVYMSGNTGLIIKTTNGGGNWNTLTTNVTDQLWGLQFVNAATGYVAGSTGRIMKTTDYGLNWVTQFSGVQNAISSLFFLNESTGFVSGSAIVLKTTNGGTNWMNMNAPYISGFENFREIYFQDFNTGYYVSDLGRILKSNNGGANWTLLSTGTSEALFGINFTDVNTAYVCGYNGTIIKTTDAGTSWFPQSSGLTEILPDIWFTSANTGYISTWTGKILKTTNGGIVGFAKTGTEIPTGFRLYQNYPNPFNPSTVISFQLSVFSYITLIVYNVTGKEVAVLEDGFFKPGIHYSKFDPVSSTGQNFQLSSGVYYYRLIAGEFSETREMILLK